MTLENFAFMPIKRIPDNPQIHESPNEQVSSDDYIDIRSMKIRMQNASKDESSQQVAVVSDVFMEKDFLEIEKEMEKQETDSEHALSEVYLFVFRVKGV